MKRLLTKASVVAVCGVCILALSGYTDVKLLEVIAGVVFLAGALTIAIIAASTGRKKIIGPDRRKPEAGMFRDAMRALAPTSVLAALIIMTGYIRQPLRPTPLILIAVFLLMSAAYWTLAAMNYKKARREESGER